MADFTEKHQHGIGIGLALRNLPTEMPIQSAWPLLAGQIPKKPGRRYFPLAMASALALLALIPASLRSPSVSENTADLELQALMQQSSQLENIAVAIRNSTAGSASAEAISLALEERIHEIDGELASGSPNPSQQLGLWQQRVTLLEEATGLYAFQRYRQAEGRPYDIEMVESF